MKAPTISLRRQLVLWNVLTLAVLLTALGLVTRFVATTTIMRSVDQHLADRAHAPPLGGRGPPDDHGPPDGHFGEGPPPDGRFHRGPPPNDTHDAYRPRVFDPLGRSLLSPSDRPWDPAALASALPDRQTYSNVTLDGLPLRVMTRALGPNRVMQDAYPLSDVNAAIAGMDRALLLLIPVALLGAGLGGALLTDRVLRPVRQVTQAAARMGDTASARLPAQGEDEFAEMAETFNGLLARLDASFQQQARLLEQQRRFTADASHELKTPLTVIQGTASQMRFGAASEEDHRQAMTEIGEAAEGMGRLVQDLLLLARSDAQRMGEGRITLLAREVLAQSIARVRRDATPIALRLEDETLTVYGNEEELVRLFANLLQNADHATPANGTITVSARRQGQDAVITIADNGVGIAPEHLAHLGERFYRVDSARARRDGGSGLGLSICRSIAEAHGGTLAFASAPGAGTTVTVTLKTG